VVGVRGVCFGGLTEGLLENSLPVKYGGVVKIDRLNLDNLTLLLLLLLLLPPPHVKVSSRITGGVVDVRS
jgi:hypothetical protein